MKTTLLFLFVCLSVSLFGQNYYLRDDTDFDSWNINHFQAYHIARLNNGEPINGVVLDLYFNGNVMNEHTFKDGKLNGRFRQYTFNGEVKVEGFYKNGYQDGLWRDFYTPNGRMKDENGLIQTEYIAFWKDGEIQWSRCYDENGKKMVCD
ncbi:hypothetical protein N9O13_04635 [Crocinitomicaceae bacterium]|mgnify:CR=1 FL=1|nr:hypothetical protein [Crocinitomicaceae bacterium]